MSSFPILFVWFLIAIFIFRHHMRKSQMAQEKSTNAFLDKEASSLVVRKKQLEEEDFLHPRLKIHDFPTQEFYAQHALEHLEGYGQAAIQQISKPMVNFSHTTNTDLRLKYGTATITTIETYEEYYNIYIQSLYMLGKGLMAEGFNDLSAIFLEEAVAMGSDNRMVYLDLANHYVNKHMADSYKELYERAKSLDSLTKTSLLNSLESIWPQVLEINDDSHTPI